MERGSFTEMALAAGAVKVIGFECLPRHTQFLKERFAREPRVEVHELAISCKSGIAPLHIATDLNGNELDFYHTLSDLPDSNSVIRSSIRLNVPTATLADLRRKAIIPEQVHLLKIDTEGHDLMVLEGLGPLRPMVILTEYWDTLPETSGICSYSLQDLACWALKHGYSHRITTRRNGPLELVESASTWSLPGDWGNVFLFRNDFDGSLYAEILVRYSLESHKRLCLNWKNLMADCVAKEAEIQRLDTALIRLRTEEKKTNEETKVSDLKSDQRPRAEEGQSHLPFLKKHTCVSESAISDSHQVSQGNRSTTPAFDFPFCLSNSKLIGKQSSMDLGAYYFHLHAPKPLRIPHRYRQSIRISSPPLISLVTPSWNQGHFIERTIKSVLDQHDSRLEYYVQDGGSADNTKEILACYSGCLAGWESAPNNGPWHAIHLAFQKTSGEIMAWVNPDDLLLPGSLAYIADFFQKHPRVDVVYGHCFLIDENDRQIGRWVLPAHDRQALSWTDFILPGTFFWRRRIWEQTGGRIDFSYPFAFHWDLLLRFQAAGAVFQRLPRFFVGFRIPSGERVFSISSALGLQETSRLHRKMHGFVPSVTDVRNALVLFRRKKAFADLTWYFRCLWRFY